MRVFIKILQTIIVVPVTIVGGILIGIVGMPCYLVACVISDVWSF